MDIDFVIQDTFALLRPQWKIAKTLEEAGGAFADACKENYKADIMSRPAEPEEIEVAEDGEVDRLHSPVDEEVTSSSDEVDDEVDDQPTTPNGIGSDDEEHIVVTRPEDERDPEAEAEFDRELAKMMSESIETRKTERPRQNFDIALPMRRIPQRDGTSAMQHDDRESELPTRDTTKFSLLSKRGNKPQVDNDFLIEVLQRNELTRSNRHAPLTYQIPQVSPLPCGHSKRPKRPSNSVSRS